MNSEDTIAALVPKLRTHALRLCRGDNAMADDVVQDAVERALCRLDQYEPGTNLDGWMVQILFTVFVGRWRRHKREHAAVERLAGDPYAWTVPHAFAAPDVGRGAISRALMRALAELPEGYGEVIVKVILEENSVQVAARELGIPVGTVMSRLYRARKLLAVQMAEAA